MSLILHLTSRIWWQEAQAMEIYSITSLITEGFIHCSRPDQMIEVANRHYRGLSGLVLLCIERSKVEAEIRDENLDGGDKLYPHIYGQLNLNAVVKVLDFPEQPGGGFVLPDDPVFRRDL